jgi:DNA primase
LIPKETVDKIVDAARVEEVIAEFITLKKRGVNLLGLCPFHGEKTPSFTVSPVKGIYKCFGCGKAGNAVNFVMDHLQLSYPESLKWLARKYGIEIVEKEFTPEEKEKQTERESMLIVMSYAQKYFTQIMRNTDEGRSIGLGYFLERGLPESIIDKFQLGYSPEARRALSEDSVKAGYQPKYMVSTGMSILSNTHVEGTEITEKDIFDRYAGRVMFPIHDDGGRVVAFGGRTLSSDKKIAKYINSPETLIYHKSKILYGLWLGKKAIQQTDVCYLVEGYMDVIAMHQAGIENVVASSGTSLTVEQIKSIHRFTRNIVVLYDGDEAGQKASNRAIPLLLEEGMNVKLLMFPDNDDPDSFSRKVTVEEFKDYLQHNTQDFLLFKAKKLSGETKNDPIKKAGIIKDIVESIALIPDNIIRSIYVKDCASVMELDEAVLQAEVNKIRRTTAKKQSDRAEYNRPQTEQPAEIDQAIEELLQVPQKEDKINFDAEEKSLLISLINFGSLLIKTQAEDEINVEHELEITLGEFIIFELWRDEMAFENPLFIKILEEYIKELSDQRLPSIQHFLNSQDNEISRFTIDNVVEKHEISKGWTNFGVIVPTKIELAKKDAQKTLFSFKNKKLSFFIHEMKEGLKNADHNDPNEAYMDTLKEIKRLEEFKIRVNRLLGREAVIK